MPASDTPSYTARGVALARSLLDRPVSATGDPTIDARVAARLTPDLPGGLTDHVRSDDFFGYLEVRTRFLDEAVLWAIGDGIPQIVILGAGYDCRAVRFRTPTVRFFEVDHPATQRDKRRLLAELSAPTGGVTFVAADFTHADLRATLRTAGHDAAARSLFVCEGVLRYLPEQSFRELLRVAAQCGASSSELAVSVSTREPDANDVDSPDRIDRERRLAAINEPVLTVPPRAVALRWIGEAGWTPSRVDEVSEVAKGSRPGRLLVRAHRS